MLLLSRHRPAVGFQQPSPRGRVCCRSAYNSKPVPSSSVASSGSSEGTRKQQPRAAGYIKRQQQQQQQQQPPAEIAAAQCMPRQSEVGFELQEAACDLVCSCSGDEATHTELQQQRTHSSTASHHPQLLPQQQGSPQANSQQYASTSGSDQQQQVARQLQGQQTTSSSSSSSSGSRALELRQQPLAPAHFQPNTHFRPMVVPWQHRGLMYQRTRPWMKQTVMHLCTGVAPPACYIYQEMAPGTLQRVVQARLGLEADVRRHLEELRWQCSRIHTWMQQAAAGDRSLPAQGLEEAAQELRTLKAAAGSSRSLLHFLRRRAEAYSDMDYVQYTEPLRAMLRQVDHLADVLLLQYIPHLRHVGEMQHRSARLADLELDANARQLTKMWQQQHQQARRKFPPCGLPAALEWGAFTWRYPPNEYVWVKPKGTAAADKQRPLRLPGEAVKLAAVRPTIRRMHRNRDPAAVPPQALPVAGSQPSSSSSSSHTYGGSSSVVRSVQGPGLQGSSDNGNGNGNGRMVVQPQAPHEAGAAVDRSRQPLSRIRVRTPLQHRRAKTQRVFDSQ